MQESGSLFASLRASWDAMVVMPTDLVGSGARFGLEGILLQGGVEFTTVTLIGGAAAGYGDAERPGFAATIQWLNPDIAEPHHFGVANPLLAEFAPHEAMK